MASWGKLLTQGVQYGSKSQEITPGATDLADSVRYVVMSETGDITVVPKNNSAGDTISFTGVPAGFVPPFEVRKVTAATVTVYSIEG